jgi:hypothetical protein
MTMTRLFKQLTAACVLAAPAAMAAVPPTLAVQGRLTGLDGGPVPGPSTLKLVLSEDADGLDVLHTENAIVIADGNGVFGTMLGTAAPLDPAVVAEADALWLTVSIAGTQLGQPIPLASVAYAMRARHADVARAMPSRTGAPAACDASTRGWMYLEAQDGKPYVCSTSGWTDLVGPAGPEGPGGPEGPKGDPGEPRTSLDGLAGGTVTGDLVVTGSITATGGSLGYPKSPRVLFGFTSGLCEASYGDTFYGFQEFPAAFPQNPIVVASNDESLNNNGATWRRLKYIQPNRFGLRCDAITDAVGWMAIDPGVHTISGKTVVAGRTTGIGNNGSVFFNYVFSGNPVVIAMPDETGDDNGMSVMRLIGQPAASGFQIWANGTADALHWIAMDPGTYTRGRFRWTAGVLTPPGNCTNSCSFTYPTPFTTAPFVLLTMHDTNNSGPTWIRVSNTTTQGFQYRMDDASLERLHWVAVETLE